MEINVKYSQGYCKYNSEIPSFLVNRPRILVLHCIERIFAAKDIKNQHIALSALISLKDHLKSRVKAKTVPGIYWVLEILRPCAVVDARTGKSGGCPASTSLPYSILTQLGNGKTSHYSTSSLLSPHWMRSSSQSYNHPATWPAP